MFFETDLLRNSTHSDFFSLLSLSFSTTSSGNLFLFVDVFVGNASFNEYIEVPKILVFSISSWQRESALWQIFVVLSQTFSKLIFFLA